jgi:hypothetical protein
MRLFEAVVDAQQFARAFATRIVKYKDLSDKTISWLIAHIKGEGIGMGFKGVHGAQDFIMKSNIPQNDTTTSQKEEVIAYANQVYDNVAKMLQPAGPLYRTQVTRQKIVNGFLLAYGFEIQDTSKLNNMKKIKEVFDPNNLDDNTFEDELEQYDSSEDFSDDGDFPELFTEVDTNEHNFDEVFNDSDLQTFDAADYDDYDFEEDEYEEEPEDQLEKEISLYHESFKKVFELSHLQEGGPRKNMSQETIDRFVHELLLVPDGSRRQEIVDEIFEKIAEENARAYEKSQKKLNVTEKEVKDEVK